MARGPDGQGQTAGFSLKDQLFNADTLSDLAREFAVLPGFDPDQFLARVLPGLEPRGLLERLDWIADCIAAQLPPDFPAMADALHAAMPPPLDPMRKDDDFGRFIHAVPGILAVRHGLEAHREQALDLLHAATQRFSMEFYIRPFLNRWPDQTLARLSLWAEDENYHVRRLVSEGTRPRLPWAANIYLDPLVPLPFLDALHADPTRYVTRSVANHLNDISKIAPDAVIGRLRTWQEQAQQDAGELDWMTRHALRTAIKRGEAPALKLLGFDPEIDVRVDLQLSDKKYEIGDSLGFSMALLAPLGGKVQVDYRLRFHRPGRPDGEKVFKIKALDLKPGQPARIEKTHRLKGDATTFRLHPGPHAVTVQVNGLDRAQATFELV